MQQFASDLASRSYAGVKSAALTVKTWASDVDVPSKLRRIKMVLDQANSGQMMGAGGVHDGSMTASAGSGGQPGPAAASTNARPNIEFPSFLAFFTSRYSFALLLLSLVINRIHATVHVQIPYRSSLKVRAICRAPAIVLLVRAILLVIGMMARLSTDVSPANKYYYSVKNALELHQTTHAQVLWSCFVATCIACASESFIRALDHNFTLISPVNLFSFGLLLHFHSVPYHDPASPPSRAIYFLILLQLAEILALQIAAIPAWRIRLWITGSFTLLSRGSMLYLWLTTTDKSHASLMPAIQSLGRILPEAFFVTCSLLTITIKGLVQIVTEGKVNKEIFGHSSSLPHRDDDFILALIKYGTAALETTAMKGLNNEVSALSFPSSTYVELNQTSVPYGSDSSALASSGRVLIQNPSHPYMPQLARSANPLDNQIQQIKAIANKPGDVDPMSRNSGLRKEGWRFFQAVWLLYKVYIVGPLARKTRVGRLARGTGRVAWFLRFLGAEADSATQGTVNRPTPLAELRSMLRKAPRASIGDALTADDDEDSDYSEESSDSSGEDSDNASDSDEVDESLRALPRSREVTPMPGRLEELSSLLEDSDDENQDLTPVLLAHLQTKSKTGSPLTRRRYNDLLRPSTASPSRISSSASDTALSTAIAIRRGQNAPATKNTDTWDDSFRGASTCVVCCSEARSIVLWPCRCLALCDGCRGELAARSTGQGGSSLCPCCRAEVQGYSRIMIP